MTKPPQLSSSPGPAPALVTMLAPGEPVLLNPVHAVLGRGTASVTGTAAEEVEEAVTEETGTIVRGGRGATERGGAKSRLTLQYKDEMTHAMGGTDLRIPPGVQIEFNRLNHIHV